MVCSPNSHQLQRSHSPHFWHLQLLTEREDQTKRINSLVLQESKPVAASLTTNGDIQQSEQYLEQVAKLAATERKIQEMNIHTSRMQVEWAQALADAAASKDAMEDMHAKHLKRWADLAEEHPDVGPENGVGTLPGNRAEEIATLQHKLTQALENVRQAEATRMTLNEAVNLNASLQAKVDEFKAKYAALQAEKAARLVNPPAANGANKN